MSDSRFLMSPERMLSTAKQFNTNAEELTQVLKNLSSAVNTLLSEWEGAGATEFENDFTTLKKSCEEMVVCVTERATALNSSANAAQALSDSIKGQWN